MRKALIGWLELKVSVPLSRFAHVCAGTFVVGFGGGSPKLAATAAPTGPLKHGTVGSPGRFASPFAPVRIAAWLFPEFVSGRKMFVFVSRGTAFCASCLSPSNAANRKVLSFRMGKPTLPPNC